MKFYHAFLIGVALAVVSSCLLVLTNFGLAQIPLPILNAVLVLNFPSLVVAGLVGGNIHNPNIILTLLTSSIQWIAVFLLIWSLAIRWKRKDIS